MHRRDFIKVGSGALLSLTLEPRGILARAKAESSHPIIISDPDPIQNLNTNQLSSRDFNGDDIERSHEALWNRDGYIARRGGIPAISERVETVIVGGGLSGLLCAYFLGDRPSVILEQGQNFGGNSRGESFQGRDAYSIGAAYLTRPDPGSITERTLKDLGLFDSARAEAAHEAKVFYQNALLEDFWKGVTDPRAHQQFQQVYQHFQWILEKKYPEIPWIPNSDLSWEEFVQLDRLSFSQWLEQNFAPLHPHVLEYFQLYCWSSFGGSIEELSAAQALNFLAAETEAVIALPGGNAAVASALYRRLQTRMGSSALRAGCIVLDVRLQQDGVVVCYETPERQLRTMKAERCIMAAPKFVAKRIVSDMSVLQQKACDAINYRAYVVANIFVDIRRWRTSGKKFSPCFDLYCLEGEVPSAPSALRPPSQAFTDICFGNWAIADASDTGILTVYKALPYDGARQFLFSPMSHEKYRVSILNGVRPLLETLGVPDQEVLGCRLTRWGHSLPLAERGALVDGYPARASAPIGHRIFFANQDNWVNPSFEAAIEAASRLTSVF